MLAGISADGKRRITWGDTALDEHPKGALTFLRLYLAFLGAENDMGKIPDESCEALKNAEF